MNNNNTSIKMSYLLRHNPEDLKMDEYGFVSIKPLLNKLNITINDLESIVKDNNKQRFSFSEDKLYIRANQGHSNGLAPMLKLAQITAIQQDFEIYHGTSLDVWNIIKETSIKPMSRNYVHWTKDINLAKKRAKQQDKDKSIIIILKCKEFIENGNKLFLSDNNVYLTDEVNNKYLTSLYLTHFLK